MGPEDPVDLVDLTISLPRCQIWEGRLCPPTPMACLHPGCSPLLLPWARDLDHMDTRWVRADPDHAAPQGLPGGVLGCGGGEVCWSPLTGAEDLGNETFLCFCCRSAAASNGYDATSTSSPKQPATSSPIRSSATLATAGSTSSPNQQHGN